MKHNFHALLMAYLEEHLKGRASHYRMSRTAKEWLLTRTTTPTRAEILIRQQAKGHGHFQPGATQANTELALLRAACRWGLYHDRWSGGDPTVGIKKWKTPKRKRIGKYEELIKLLQYFARASTELECRDRALYGLMLFTGCRPSEARTARLDAITPYGAMGAWNKGTTKTGETHELPLPTQLMPWLAAWTAFRSTSRPTPYLFPGHDAQQPMSSDMVRLRWHDLRLMLGITGLWNYDLRRTLACGLSNELQYDDHTIRAILNHADGSALGHYCFKSFDALTGPIQRYADWLCGLMPPEQAGMSH
jgi:integrase